jgi:hypothetical protein
MSKSYTRLPRYGRGHELPKLALSVVSLRIPIYSGQVFRREAGHRSDLKPATIPK